MGTVEVKDSPLLMDEAAQRVSTPEDRKADHILRAIIFMPCQSAPSILSYRLKRLHRLSALLYGSTMVLRRLLMTGYNSLTPVRIFHGLPADNPEA